VVSIWVSCLKKLFGPLEGEGEISLGGGLTIAPFPRRNGGPQEGTLPRDADTKMTRIDLKRKCRVILLWGEVEECFPHPKEEGM